MELKAGEILAVVGESGSGKSVTGKALLGLIESPGMLAAGEILIKGEKHRRTSPRWLGEELDGSCEAG